jgi:hypothetical protein
MKNLHNAINEQEWHDVPTVKDPTFAMIMLALSNGCQPEVSCQAELNAMAYETWTVCHTTVGSALLN